MKRESFKSRLGFLLVSARMCDRYRQCMEISICGRTETGAVF